MRIAAGGDLEILEGLHLAWAGTADVPDGDAWLSMAERAVLDGLGVPKRRADWRLGRWTAKRAVRSLLRPTLDEADPSVIEILADGDGRPGVGFAGVHLSLSHSAGVGYAAASTGAAPIGCDVEGLESRSALFVADYFTERESAVVQRTPPETAPLITNLIWSAKESALKALGQGLRIDTRTVEVDAGDWGRGLPATGRAGPVDRGWRPLRASGPGGSRFQGSWRVRDGMVWTVLRGQ